MKEFFDRMDIFLEKCDPLFCFLGIVVIGALVYYKLTQRWRKTGRLGAVKAIFMVAYIIGASIAAVFILAPLFPAWLGGVMGFFAATVAAAWAETKADTPYMVECQKKLNAEILKKFGISMD